MKWPLDCGTCLNVTISGGQIESPNYPNYYGGPVDCIYRIGVESGKKIRLTFSEFYVETVTGLLTVI